MYWQSRLDDSESLSAQALSLGKKLLGNNNAQVARSYLLQARAKMAQGKMAEASSDYKTGETILTKIKAPGDPMLGDGLNCLAQFYCQSGQLTKSRDFFEQALRTYETAFGKESPHAAECLDGLARIATLEKDYDRAESLYKQALSMSAKTRGESHVAVGRSLANLGWMYLQKKNYAEATDCLEQSIAIFEQNALGDSLDLSMADLYLGQSLVAKGNVAAAEPLFKRALNIAQRVEPHGKLALESFNQLVKIYRLQNRKQDIVDLLKTVQTPARGGPGHGGES